LARETLKLSHVPAAGRIAVMWSMAGADRPAGNERIAGTASPCGRTPTAPAPDRHQVDGTLRHLPPCRGLQHRKQGQACCACHRQRHNPAGVEQQRLDAEHHGGHRQGPSEPSEPSSCRMGNDHRGGQETRAARQRNAGVCTVAITCQMSTPTAAYAAHVEPACGGGEDPVQDDP
jgi:hypothetical protein